MFSGRLRFSIRHKRSAPFLAEPEPLIGRRALPFRHGIIMIDLGRDLDYISNLPREGIYLGNEISSAVCQAVSNNGLKVYGQVAGFRGKPNIRVIRDNVRTLQTLLLLTTMAGSILRQRWTLQRKTAF